MKFFRCYLLILLVSTMVSFGHAVDEAEGTSQSETDTLMDEGDVLPEKSEDGEDMKQAEGFINAHSHHRLSSNFMLSLYQNLSRGVPLNRATGRHNHWRPLKHADTVRTFEIIGSFETRMLQIYKFNLTHVGDSEILRAAELHFWLPFGWNHLEEMYVVSMSFGKGLEYASSIPILTPSFSNEGLAILDVTIPVKDWLQEFVRSSNRDLNEHTLDLAVVVVSRRKTYTRSKLLRHLERIYESGVIEKQQQHPLDVILVTYSEAGRGFLNETSIIKHQTKRSTDASGSSGNQSAATNNAPACRRKDLKVHFPALGWGEWVVYPTLFNAYQCAGKCGGFTDSRHNPTNHAIVQSLVRLVSRHDIPIPCCTPTKLSPLSILYLEKGSVVIKHHEDMIVEECGCL